VIDLDAWCFGEEFMISDVVGLYCLVDLWN